MIKKMSFSKRLHKWPAFVVSFIAIQFAISGIVMNHREWFSSFEVKRAYLPNNYTYSNWNLASVRGGFQVGADSTLIYGNVGAILKVQNQFNTINTGFKKGADNRKIYKVVKYKNKLIAATHFGLFETGMTKINWKEIPIPVENKRLTDVCVKGDSIIVLSRSIALVSTDLVAFSTIQFKAPSTFKKKTSAFNFLWELHSGELFGFLGKLFVDFLGIVTIILSVTGLLHFMIPKRIKVRKKKNKNISKLKLLFKSNLKWHNVLGYSFILFMLINTIAGMFLRPPLLIPIANKEVKIIPGTHLDSPNAWYDKLRRIDWNAEGNFFLLSTKNGFYKLANSLNAIPETIDSQPPVSVMGCNVLEPLNSKSYLVGSFSGLFYWDVETGYVRNFLTNAQYLKPKKVTKPVSDFMVAGLIRTEKEGWYCDYNSGMVSLNGYKPWPMPEEYVGDATISLWNLCLEIHTGRIYESFLGMFYILFVPISGICLVLVLLSGLIIWLRRRK